MGGHPLRSPTRRCLGRPLPYQLADGPQAPPEVIALRQPFVSWPLTQPTTCGISSPFGLLFPTSGQVTYVLRTHSPLSPVLRPDCVRLACLKHAASVHPEPGSNSPYDFYRSEDRRILETSYRLPGTRPDNRVDHPTEMRQSPQAAYHGASSYHSSVVKVPHFPRETKNRCKPISFASAQVQARSLGCTVCPAHGGLNDLLADYTQRQVPVKGKWEIESVLGLV